MMDFFKWNKKGEYGIDELVIFIVLNIIFFVVILLFLMRASSGTQVYEQAYAKQIAIAIDSALPGMKIMIAMPEAIVVANKEKFPIDKIVSFDEVNSRVIVKLSDTTGYSHQYFSNYKIKVLDQFANKRSFIFEVAKNE